MISPLSSARPRRASAIRLRPRFDGLEDRTVPSTAALGHLPTIAAAVAHPHHAIAHLGNAHAKINNHFHFSAGAHRAVAHHSGRTPMIFGVPITGGPTASFPSFNLPLTTTTTTTATTDPAAAPTTAATPAATPPASPAPTTPAATAATPPTTTAAATNTATTVGAPTQLIQLNLKPIDLNLLGLEVQTSAITVTVSAQSGNGQLLGNLLGDVGNLLNLQGVNTALNNVLGSVVNLVNSTSLSISGVNTTSGPLSGAPTTAAATTPVLDLLVAPVHVNLLGALVDTSPIHLTITAHSGQGLVLGNVVADLANLFNPPLPNKLTLGYINGKLGDLLNELNQQIPNIGNPTTTTTTSTSAPTTTATGTENVLRLTVPPINVNLLGLVLKTSQIQVNADATTGNGDLLGNLLVDALNTLDATQQDISTLNTTLNGILSKVVGVLNASSLILPSNAVSQLSQVLQTLAVPTLITSTANASTPVLNLSIDSTNGTTPPVDLNLLGLVVTTSNIDAQLIAQTGDGQILGNLVYNVSNLLNPGGSLNVLTILNQLGV